MKEPELLVGATFADKAPFAPADWWNALAGARRARAFTERFNNPELAQTVQTVQGLLAIFQSQFAFPSGT